MSFKLARKTAIIVGASSGLGEAIAKQLGRKGWKLALVARRKEKLEELADQIGQGPAKRPLVYAHDVTKYSEVPALFNKIVEDLGGLELFVQTAGIMPDIGPEEYDFDKDKRMVEVNLLGTIAWCNEAADLFTRLQAGTILGVGSVAGDRGRHAMPVYGATKGAQAIYLESLRNRLASRGVRVVTIKPGPIATPMTEGLGNLPFMISATKAAQVSVDAALSGKSKTVYVPWRWTIIMAVIRAIPSFIFRKLKI